MVVAVRGDIAGGLATVVNSISTSADALSAGSPPPLVFADRGTIRT